MHNSDFQLLKYFAQIFCNNTYCALHAASIYTTRICVA
jgi:hypothetical protein